LISLYGLQQIAQSAITDFSLIPTEKWDLAKRKHYLSMLNYDISLVDEIIAEELIKSTAVNSSSSAPTSTATPLPDASSSSTSSTPSPHSSSSSPSPSASPILPSSVGLHQVGQITEDIVSNIKNSQKEGTRSIKGWEGDEVENEKS
jgi:hypothetical protein